LKETLVQFIDERIFPHRIDTDEHNLLTPVAPDFMEIRLHGALPFGFLRPVLPGHGGPPAAPFSRAHQGPRLTDLADEIRPCRQPEEALRPHDTRPALVDERLEPFGIEGTPRAIDKGANAIFLGLGRMRGKTVQLLVPERMFMRLVEVEQLRVQYGVERHVTEIGLLNAGIGIERTDDLAGEITLIS